MPHKLFHLPLPSIRQQKNLQIKHLIKMDYLRVVHPGSSGSEIIPFPDNLHNFT
jgi:hypothetical protein